MFPFARIPNLGYLFLTHTHMPHYAQTCSLTSVHHNVTREMHIPTQVLNEVYRFREDLMDVGCFVATHVPIPFLLYQDSPDAIHVSYARPPRGKGDAKGDGKGKDSGFNQHGTYCMSDHTFALCVCLCACVRMGVTFPCAYQDKGYGSSYSDRGSRGRCAVAVQAFFGV